MLQVCPALALTVVLPLARAAVPMLLSRYCSRYCTVSTAMQ
jgi:hypothetical protein